MDTFFKDRNVKVLVVDPSGASRTLLSEVIRSLGFNDVHGVPNLKDALGIMEVEPVRWLVSPFGADQPENLFQVLKFYDSYPELRQLRVSALVEDSELDLLPPAFERGLLSYHKKPFTKDSLSSDLNDFLARYEKFGWKSSHTAGSYLRQCLQSLNNFEELLAFERQLLKLSPGDMDQYLNLVPPLIRTNKVDEAKAILSQVRRLDPTFEDNVNRLSQTYLGEELSEGSNAWINILGLKSAVVIDSDAAVQNEIKSALAEIGVEIISVFDDGEKALEFIRKNQNPGLILQEWRIPKLTGPLFLQKAHEEGAKNSPFILISSLIQKEDTPFVREMGIANILNKPIKRKNLIEGIIWTIQQDRQPTEQTSMERKIRQLLGEKKVEEARLIYDRYMGDHAIKIGAKLTIEAEFAYAMGNYEKARDFGIEAIKNAGESIFILSLLGKSLINLREFQTALKCFQKAQSIAPQNIERLCQIAEIHSELGDHAKATEILEEVKDLDPDSQKAQEGEAKVAINSGDSTHARKIMSQLRAMENVVSYMNNQAVAMARVGMVDQGIDQYRKTLDAVPIERPDIRSIVEYNLALAYLRSNNVPEARKCLEEAAKAAESKVKGKVAALLKKVTVAMEKGVNITIAKSESAVQSKTPEARSKTYKGGENPSSNLSQEEREAIKGKILSVVESRPGDLGCYLVYKCSISVPRLQKMLEANIRFNPRKAIERRESFGADRMLASG